MGAIGKFVLNWLWGKIIPIVVKFFKDMAEKAKINREVNEETNEIKEIKKQIKEYQKKNGTKDIPPNLKQALLRASRKRVRDL